MDFGYKPGTSEMCMVHFEKDRQQSYCQRKMFQQSHHEVSLYSHLSL